jgi:peptide/nickel transport system substrate-binding protein
MNIKSWPAHLSVRRVVQGVAVAVGAAILAPAAQAGPGDPAVDRDTVVIGADRSLSSLDVIRTNTPDGNRFQMLVYDSLYGFDPDGNLEPRLATEVISSDDAKTFSYKLREGVKFHDGTAFDSADVKFSLERILNPANKSTRRPMFAGLVETIETPDPQTVTFKLSRPDGVFTNKVAGYLSIYAADPAVPETESSYARKPVSLGPYKVKSFPDSNKTLELERFDDYWGPKPAIKNIVFKVITENTSRINAILTGEVDLASAIAGKDKARIEAVDYLEFIKTPLAAPMLLKPYLNDPNHPLYKKEVRQAITTALDRDAIIKHVLHDIGEPMAMPISKYFPYGGGGNLEPYPYDPAKAKALLAEAGYPNGFDLPIWMNNTYPKELGEAVVAYLGEVGIKVELRPIEWQTYIRMVNQGELGPMYFGINANPIYDPIHQVVGHYGKGGTWNTWDNPEVQKLIDEVIPVIDSKKRGELFEQIGKIMYEEQPSIQISELFESYVLKRGLNWKPYKGSTILDFEQAGWK